MARTPFQLSHDCVLDVETEPAAQHEVSAKTQAGSAFQELAYAAGKG